MAATAAVEAHGLDPHDFSWLIEERSMVWASYFGLSHRCYDHAPLNDWLTHLGTYEIVINLEQRYGLSAALALTLTSKQGKLVGFSTNRGKAAFTHVVPYDSLDRHEVSAFADAFAIALDLTSVEIQPRTRMLDAGGYTLIAIAGTGQPSRNWTAREWVRIIERFASDRRIVIVSAPADEPIAIEIANSMKRDCSTMSGSWALVCDAVARADRVLTVDGGMVHVASYFGVPVDAIFTAGRHAKWAPWSAGSKVIRRTDLACQPCTLFGIAPQCGYAYECKAMLQWESNQP